MKRFSNKQGVLFGLVALVVVASGDWQIVSPVNGKSSTTVAQTTVRDGNRSAARRGEAVVEVAEVKLNSLGKRSVSGVKAIDVFKGKSWYVPPPPPPPPKPVPPPPPTAPPLPYIYLGSYQEPGGRLIIFLTRGERVYSVSPGEVVENTYRVDGVAAGQLSLTYLPLNIKQTMNIGDLS